MPVRTEKHRQGSRRYKATLYFISEDPALLSGSYASDVIADALELAVHDAAEPFRSFVACVEAVHGASVSRQTLPRRRYRLEGEILFMPLLEPTKVLRQKLAHEAAHKRVPGYASYQPESFLRADKCVIVLGSPAFLFEHADLCLERTGALREKTLDIAKLLLRIPFRSQAGPLADSMFQINLWERSFYPGNFDALIEAVKGPKRKTRLSTADALKRISALERNS